jgi:glycosyltransferase 2 family protein
MRGFLVLASRILVSGALLYLALRGIDFATIQSRLLQSSTAWIIGWMVLSVLVTIVQVFFGAMRWREISGHCGAPLHIAQAFRYSMIGTFFNQTLPSTIGGDALRLWLVGRTGAGWRAAAYSVFVDRAIGLIALAIVVVFSLPWSYQLIGDAQGRVALILIDFAAISAGLGFLLLGYLPWAWLKTWWPTRHLHARSLIANRVIFDRHSGPKIAILSLCVHILTIRDRVVRRARDFGPG